MQTHLISVAVILTLALTAVQSDDCVVPVLYHGDLKELKYGDYYWNWRTFRYEREMNYVKATVGKKVQDNEILLLRCSDGYEVLGTDKKEDSVSCKLGKWSHELQCEPASCRNGPPSAQNSQAVVLNQEHGGRVLYLCDEDFKKTENESVVCDFGIWKGKPPVCKNTSCRNGPPSAQNSQAVVLNPEHGGRVLYLCDEDFKKIENESVVCDFGIWKGKPPVCKNTRCFVDDLTFPGLVKGRKMFYRHRETFEVECDSRYQVANPNRTDLRCEDGAWKGPLPPCVAASCQNPPPEIDRGQAEVRSTAHGSIVKYTCRDPYTLSGNSEVQCLFGDWASQPPKCEDNRCYLKNLQNSAHVDVAATDSVTFSGNRLVVKCKEGYSPTSDRPVCLHGNWRGNYASPCKENDCIVPVLYHGDIKELKIGDYYWSWTTFRYEREMKYVKIYTGTVLPYGSTVNLICHEHFSFQGIGVINQRITCFKGQWLPHPVCLRVGETYVPRTTTQKPYTTTLARVTEQRKTVVTPTKVSEHSLPTTHEVTSEETSETITPITEETQTSQVKSSVEECYCEYPINDENLIAHVDEKSLKFHDKVKNDSVVVFRCKHVGFHRLEGVQSMKCEGCRSWHSSEFPTCSKPERGNAFVIYDKTLNVSTEGNLEAKKGQDVKLMCVGVESDMYPQWSIPKKNGVTIKRERMNKHGAVVYISHLEIENVDFENEGKYVCAGENNSMNVVNLVINAPQCAMEDIFSALPENVVLDVDDMKKTVPYNTAIKLTCANEMIVEGEPVAKCNRKGEWIVGGVHCSSGCLELETDPDSSLIISPHKKVYKLGDIVTFLCPPGMSATTESQPIICLKYGWSETVLPDCH